MVSIRAWLLGLGLGQYERAFCDNDIDASLLPTLTDGDLRELGVVSLGHRKQLLAAIAELHRPASGPSAVASAMGQAERRQLTIMFVDLVGSTALSSRLDPEDMRQVLRAYQNAVMGEIARGGGHLAKLMGDGVLAYFGWPRANEDDAERAVQAGLTIVQAVKQLSTPFGEPLAARVGIATGLVIVGDLIGDGAAREEAVVGETPNLAARLQEVASCGTVVIAAGTRRLLGDAFDLRDLGPIRLKGFNQPVSGFVVLRPHLSESRFEARQSGRATPMVGRDQELALVLRRWRQSIMGDGKAVLLVGEAGIGKSRLVQALLDRVAADAHIALRYQCSPHYTGTPLWPVVQQLLLAAGFGHDDGDEQKLNKLETLLRRGVKDISEAAPLIAGLLGIEAGSRYPPLDISPQQRRARTQMALIQQLLGRERRKPVLMVVEDLHWIDPTTLELIGQILDRVVGARVLMLLTTRPDNQPHLGEHSHMTRLALNRLDRRQAEAIVARLSGSSSLPPAVLGEIAARSDGVPLFIEELTKAVLETGMTAPGTVPASLYASLLARLDRVPGVREVAQVAACIGREFGFQLLSAVSPLPVAELQTALERLVEAELVFRHGTPTEANYAFKHALVRDTAHESLLKANRREIHAKIVRVLETRFPETVEREPELLARHCGEAKLLDEAVDYWQRAGQQALRRSALVEAIAHLRMGLDVLGSLPPGPERLRRELVLQLALGHSWLHARGFAAAETGSTYARAHELCLELVDVPELPQALYGRCAHHVHRGELNAALKLARDLLSAGEQRGDGSATVAGHRMVGVTLCLLGRLGESRAHLEAGARLYDPERDRTSAFTYASDSRVMCLVWLSQVLVMLGYPEQGAARHNEALRHAGDLSQANTSALAFSWGCMTLQLLHDVPNALEESTAAVALAAELGFPLYQALGDVVHGWAVAGNGQLEEAIALMQRGFDDYRATEAEALSPYFLCLRAELTVQTQQAAAGLNLVAAGLEKIDRTQTRWIEAELYRVRGELLRALPKADSPEAEACFYQALGVADEQNARLWQLRCATSLARMWNDEGRLSDACDLLSPIYGWFTEGFDRPDLVEAKSLLDEFGGAIRRHPEAETGSQ
ncbi:hypothetical protein N181_24160 [Sinorhizobium fredii USDA 205]|uniref:adenylate/guanylate cyclase domain-containing protein n=1 Tax=Rhizobium fredii TaxID=380 RepID=UPI00055A928D|nr:adenylate/guanylate cyclase domain-containing protein [Sinorhizobium fredii]KSV84462.1 hypothetical protein N181_24160 [Sinorhizobium fredii USDA 205]GEC33245.1 adenylate cyclase [Sinorhizobium fredii]GLS08315.1 adenylate cyclase [Sinorhizobium fredii]